MRRPRSLQRRLGVGLAVGVTGMWLAAMLAAGLIVHHELDEAFDSALQETAQRLLPLAVLDA
jgi:two-component system OmpR family sensor kinase